ncbi:MAG: phosphate acetyltransferase, partial [Eggerthellaceae bacterium]|nr:phosphate acetyltransferase [Eggerthellaceae bacterium]
MTPFVEKLLERASADKQTIVLPEGNDYRTLIAAETILEHDAADLIIIGDAEELAAVPYNLTGAYIVDNKTDPAREELAQAFYELRKHKG